MIKLISTLVVFLFFSISGDLSASYQEVYIDNYDGIQFNKKPIPNLKEMNDYLSEKLAILSSSNSFDKRNFAVAGVYYHVDKQDDLDFSLLNNSNENKLIYASGLVSTGFLNSHDFIDFKSKDKNAKQDVLNTFLKRGNVTLNDNEDGYLFHNHEDNTYTDVEEDQINYEKPSDSFVIRHDVLQHSEQSILHRAIYGESITDNKVDFVLLNIVSRYPACHNCFTALEQLLTGDSYSYLEKTATKKGKKTIESIETVKFPESLKDDFLASLFPNSIKDTKVHILYNYLTNTNHRKVERTKLKKIPTKDIDIKNSKSLYFINMDMSGGLKKIDQPNMIEHIDEMFVD